MNLPVHSGPTECIRGSVSYRCPCIDCYHISPFELFQPALAALRIISLLLLTPVELNKAVTLSPVSISILNPAEGEGLPQKSSCRKVLAVLPVLDRSFVPLSFPPSLGGSERIIVELYYLEEDQLQRALQVQVNTGNNTGHPGPGRRQKL